MGVVGARKLLFATLLIVGIWTPFVTKPAAAGVAVPMLGAVAKHVKAESTPSSVLAAEARCACPRPPHRRDGSRVPLTSTARRGGQRPGTIAPMVGRPQVGTLGEKPLHAALKRWYAEDGDRIEQPVDEFVIDLVRDGVLIEIQTRGFSSMKRKLERLLDGHAVHVVHPIAIEKWIVKLDEAGRVTSRRKSPWRGAAVDLFGELVSFPELIARPDMTLEVLLIREEEVRRFDGRRGWRRKGWVVEERRLLEVVDRLVVDSPRALASLLPGGLPGEFTTAELAGALRRNRRLAQQMAYCLRRVGVIRMVGKDGNAVVYSRTDDSAPRNDRTRGSQCPGGRGRPAPGPRAGSAPDCGGEPVVGEGPSGDDVAGSAWGQGREQTVHHLDVLRHAGPFVGGTGLGEQGGRALAVPGPGPMQPHPRVPAPDLSRSVAKGAPSACSSALAKCRSAAPSAPAHQVGQRLREGLAEVGFDVTVGTRRGETARSRGARASG